MKFTFYYDSKKGKKKQQTIKAKSNDDLKRVATVAKCELTKKTILSDIDFNEANLVCEVDGKKLTMKDLINYITSTPKKKKNKDSDSKKKKKSKKESSGKNKKKDKKKKKNKDRKKDSSPMIINEKPKVSTNNGLIKITRRR